MLIITVPFAAASKVHFLARQAQLVRNDPCTTAAAAAASSTNGRKNGKKKQNTITELLCLAAAQPRYLWVLRLPKPHLPNMVCRSMLLDMTKLVYIT
jgi:hypothetical protein